MPTKTIRVKVCGGHLEPVDELPLPDGSEATVTITLAEPSPTKPRPPAFRTWNLGLKSRRITREDAYADEV
jgi:hypothetical protein